MGDVMKRRFTITRTSSSDMTSTWTLLRGNAGSWVVEHTWLYRESGRGGASRTDLDTFRNSSAGKRMAVKLEAAILSAGSVLQDGGD